MRTLTDHIVSGDQAVQLQIEVVDEAGSGRENHQYRVSARYANGEKLPLRSRVQDQTIAIAPDGSSQHTLECIVFQNGPIKEAGVNGITQEALLAICIDRLRSFQEGPLKCRENAIALTHLEEALMWLQRRTVARIKRGVESTQ